MEKGDPKGRLFLFGRAVLLATSWAERTNTRDVAVGNLQIEALHAVDPRHREQIDEW
jgi:hypothetical protein